MSSQATGRIPPPNVPGKRARSEVSFAPKNTPAAHTAAPVIPPEPRIRAPEPVIPHPAHLRRCEAPKASRSPVRRQEPP